jgi:hypothetical protein
MGLSNCLEIRVALPRRGSARSANLERTHWREIAVVAGNQGELVLLGCGCDDRVCYGEPVNAAEPSGALSDLAIDRSLCEWSQHSHDPWFFLSTSGKQLAPRDRRVRDGIAVGLHRSGATQVVDEDVGVNEDVCHVPATACGPAFSYLGWSRTSLSVPYRGLLQAPPGRRRRRLESRVPGARAAAPPGRPDAVAAGQRSKPAYALLLAYTAQHTAPVEAPRLR